VPLTDNRQEEWLPVFFKLDNQLFDNCRRMAEDEELDSQTTIRPPEAMRARLRARAAWLLRSPRTRPDGCKAL